MPLEEPSSAPVFEPVNTSSEKERYPSYVGYEEPSEFVNQPAQPAQVVLTMDGPTVFHLTSICCALLSFFVSPLIEFVPIVMWCLMKEQIKAQTEQEHGQLHKIDLICTAVGFVISLIMYALITILSFGIFFIFLLFPLLYVVVFVQLRKSPPLPASPIYENEV